MKTLCYRTGPASWISASALLGAMALLAACSGATGSARSLNAEPAPRLAKPDGPPAHFDSFPEPQVIDLTDGGFGRGANAATIIDTRTFPEQIQHVGPFEADLHNKTFLPEHQRPGPVRVGVPNDLVAARSSDQPRATPGVSFPGIIQTGWTPPDPTLAVGPDHIVSTVNQSIAFHTKEGAITFQARLNVTGNPGFFEDVGAGGFTFDPKCFYDHLAERFVVFAPETYGSTQAWITIAVSDDSDPNGVWYKYRTDAVIQVGAMTYWWDYPGFGYDEDGYYVTGNLFGLNQGGFGGVGFRVFDKAPMLVGDPVVHFTLRDGNGGTVQSAQHFGANQAPYFVSNSSTSAIKVQAIVNPITAPSLVTTNVGVPGFSGPGSPPVLGGTVGITGSGMLNAHWRDGSLYATHQISSGGKTVARWYEFATNDWPNSGSVSLVQSGNVDPGGDVHSWFPAIYANGANEVGIMMGTSSPSQRIAVEVAGRTVFDPPGVMSATEMVALSGRNGGGRKGDYFDIAIDPIDDRTFWYIGETFENFGWSTEIGSFTVADPTMPLADDDEGGLVLGGEQVLIDVLANDYHPGGLAFDLDSTDPQSAAGGALAIVPGGVGEPDTVSYTAPFGFSGADTFDYTVRDEGGATADATVTVDVLQESDFREPDVAGSTRLGLATEYFALSDPQSIPDFDLLSPFESRTSNQLNFAWANGPAAGSTASDNVGAVFTGFVVVPETDVYTFTLTSDDGSRLYIGDEVVVENDGVHTMVEASGTIPLKAGTHELRIEYFENFGGAGLIAEFESLSAPREVIPFNVLIQSNACAADLIAPDGVLDFSDVSVFLVYFSQGYPPADMAPPFGTLDFADIIAFLSAFAAGCP